MFYKILYNFIIVFMHLEDLIYNTNIIYLKNLHLNKYSILFSLGWHLRFLRTLATVMELKCLKVQFELGALFRAVIVSS